MLSFSSVSHHDALKVSAVCLLSYCFEGRLWLCRNSLCFPFHFSSSIYSCNLAFTYAACMKEIGQALILRTLLVFFVLPFIIGGCCFLILWEKKFVQSVAENSGKDGQRTVLREVWIRALVRLSRQYQGWSASLEIIYMLNYSDIGKNNSASLSVVFLPIQLIAYVFVIIT